MATRTRAEKKKAEPVLTEYVVLQSVTIATTRPEALKDTAHQAVWAPVLNQVTANGMDGVPRIFRAGSKTQAIRQHTGDGPEVVEGSWRAIPLSSWRGGVTTKRVTAAERLPLDG